MQGAPTVLVFECAERKLKHSLNLGAPNHCFVHDVHFHRDGFVMAVEWGATPRALVRSALQAEPQIAAKLLGLVLNKTDFKQLPRYGLFGGALGQTIDYLFTFDASKLTGEVMLAASST